MFPDGELPQPKNLFHFVGSIAIPAAVEFIGGRGPAIAKNKDCRGRFLNGECFRSNRLKKQISPHTCRGKSGKPT